MNLPLAEKDHSRRISVSRIFRISNPVPVSEHDQRRLATCLAFIAGYIDGYGLLVLGTYVSFMSGNTTMAGTKAGQEDLTAALAPVVAILGFVGGSLIGSLITHARVRHTHRMLFSLISTLFIIALLLSGHGGSHGVLRYVTIALLSFAMGMVNPALAKVGPEAVSLTFMTGTLSRLGGHLALGLRGDRVPDSEGPWDSHFRRARLDAQMWAAFIIGATLAGIVLSHAASYALFPAIAIMVLLALFVPNEPPAASPSR